MNMRVKKLQPLTRVFDYGSSIVPIVACSTHDKLIDEIDGKLGVAFVASRLEGLVVKRAVTRIGNVGTGMEGEVGVVGAARRRVSVDFRRADRSAKR